MNKKLKIALSVIPSVILLVLLFIYFEPVASTLSPIINFTVKVMMLSL